MDKLQGKVAIITGGASGIGKGVAEVFAEADIAGLVIVDIENAEEAAAEFDDGARTRALGIRADVAAAAQVEAMVEQAVSEFGRVDILVNNAGIAPPIKWPDVTEENWRHVLDINLNGAFLCTLNVLPIMCRQQSGRIVNISSVGAFLGSVSAHPAYGVSKAGLIAMTKSLAKAYAKDGILVNAVAPGSIDTPLARSLGPDQVKQYIDTALLKRQGSPHELADAVFYLVSDRSTYVTGSTLHVNGGSLLI